jgi:hypothetical protein
MTRVLGTLAAILGCLIVAPLQATPYPEEGVGEEELLFPAPYRAMARVIVSSSAATTVEIEIVITEPQRLPSSDPVPVGLVAVAPKGNVSAAIIEAQGAAIDDLDSLEPLLVNDLPANAVEVADPVIWRDLRLVGLSVAPCWESGERAVVARRLVVTLRNIGGIGINEKTRPVTAVSPIWDRLYSRHVMNYNWLNLPRLERGDGNRYIIISREAFSDQIPQFEEWKTKQGYGVKLVTLEEITGQENPYPPNQSTLDATKAYILNAYNTWPETPEFVLLVGDMDSSNYSRSIWTKTFYNYFYGQGNRPHDQWYGFLEGEDDVFADVMVGRFPDTNLSRMDYMFSKTLSYEKTPWIEPGNEWQSHAIMTLDSNISQTINTKNDVSDLLTGWGMDVDEFFSSPWNVIPAMNEGFTFYNYRGDNCGSTSWGWTFFDSDVAYVQNTKKPGVFTILSCSSACFDYSYSSTAELLLRHGYSDPANYKGAIAFMGSQAYTAYPYNNPLDEGFYRQWTNGGAAILGEAFLGAKAWAWEHMYPGYDPNRRDCMMREYTILGDPSLQVWTRVPEGITVEPQPQSVVMEETTDIVVTVEQLPSGGLEDALVCLWKSDDVYVYGYTDVSGSVTLPVTPATAGEMQLTVTAYNSIPFFGTIPVLSGPQPPQSPQNVTAELLDPNGVRITWNEVTHDIDGAELGIDYYEIYRKGNAWFTIENLNPLGTTANLYYDDLGVIGHTEMNYFYRIVAVSTDDLESEPSNPAGEFDYQLEQ